MTLRAWLKDAEQKLQNSGSPDPRPDAELIAEWALSASRTGLLLQMDTVPDTDVLAKMNDCLARRMTGRPLQYVLGEAWFYGRRFACDERVLIPRQDTETLCEEALHTIHGAMRVLDLCTGSGILAVTVKLERPACLVTATDISPDALVQAEGNARALGADVEFRQGDLFDAVPGERFDRILCNPPYLTGDDMRLLQREVRYEPELALYGGEDGLAMYRRILHGAREHLNPGGILLMEIGASQAEAVCALVPRAKTSVLRDLQGLDRVVVCRMVD